MSDYYEILSVQRSASLDEIKKAYRTLSKKYHPDYYSDKSDSEKEKAEEITKKLNEAYETLSNQKMRKAYDSTLYENGSHDYQESSTKTSAQTTQEYAHNTSTSESSYSDRDFFNQANYNYWYTYQAHKQNYQYEEDAKPYSKVDISIKLKIKNFFKGFSLLLVPVFIIFIGIFIFYHFYYGDRLSPVGSYTLESITSDGKTETAEDYARLAKIFKKMGVRSTSDYTFGKLVLRKNGTGIMTLRGDSKDVAWNNEKMVIMNVPVSYTLKDNTLTVAISKTTTLVFIMKKNIRGWIIITLLLLVLIGYYNATKEKFKTYIKGGTKKFLKGLIGGLFCLFTFTIAEIIPGLFIYITFFEDKHVHIGSYDLFNLSAGTFFLTIIIISSITSAIILFVQLFEEEGFDADCFFGTFKAALYGAIGGAVGSGILILLMAFLPSARKIICVIFTIIFTCCIVAILIAVLKDFMKSKHIYT